MPDYGLLGFESETKTALVSIDSNSAVSVGELSPNHKSGGTPTGIIPKTPG